MEVQEDIKKLMIVPFKHHVKGPMRTRRFDLDLFIADSILKSRQAHDTYIGQQTTLS